MDRVAHALADPIRREILRILSGGVASAGAIAGAFSVSRPAVSRHLRVLREAGLVHGRVQGRERQYRSELAPLSELESYLRELRATPTAGMSPATWQRRFDALETEVKRVGRTRRETSVSQRREPSRSRDDKETA